MHVVHLPRMPELRATLLAALAALVAFTLLVLAAEPLGSGTTSSPSAAPSAVSAEPLPALTPSPAGRPAWLYDPLAPPLAGLTR